MCTTYIKISYCCSFSCSRTEHYMEENIKRKVEFTVAGITMSLITDENDAFVNSVVKRMDDKMSALLHDMKRSRLDAAMLCAIAFCGDKITAEKRVRNLEAQVSLYDVNMRRLKEEIAELKARLGDTEPAKKVTVKPVSEQITMDEEPAAEAEAAPAETDREDKLKMIESLLKREK